MHVTDLDGNRIEVTDLDTAIQQATMFADMHHENDTFKTMDEYLKTYWRDILNKLKELNKEFC